MGPRLQTAHGGGALGGHEFHLVMTHLIPPWGPQRACGQTTCEILSGADDDDVQGACRDRDRCRRGGGGLWGSRGSVGGLPPGPGGLNGNLKPAARVEAFAKDFRVAWRQSAVHTAWSSHSKLALKRQDQEKGFRPGTGMTPLRGGRGGGGGAGGGMGLSCFI